GGRSADKNAGRRDPRDVVPAHFETVNERRDVRNLRRCKGEGRHRPIGTAYLDDRRDQLAALIPEDELGAQQIRSAPITASRLGAVAEDAMDAVQRLTALEDRRISGWSRRIGGTWRADRDLSATAAAARRRLWRRLRHDMHGGGTRDDPYNNECIDRVSPWQPSPLEAHRIPQC